MSKIVIAISTYKRPQLLQHLLKDLTQQSVKPDHVVIVDGDPDSCSVTEMLRALKIEIPITYIASNYGNLAYQRYIAWRAASDVDADILIYFDDDIRLSQTDVLAWLTQALKRQNVVGVGCFIRFGESSDGSDAGNLRHAAKTSWMARTFGTSRHTAPGDLTPIGQRRMPVDNQQDYVEVSWLNGPVMAYAMPFIQQQSFSDDLFALVHIRCGLGEDTFLSRRVGAHGPLLFTFRTWIDHPNADTPKAYPDDAYSYAYAAAYSRRFLNDHYRAYRSPTVADRWALLKHYLARITLTWTKALTKPSKLHFAVARGTSLGSLHGIIRPPTAQNMTPQIKWWEEAEKALAGRRLFPS